MEYILAAVDTILFFLSPLREVYFDPDFILGLIIVIVFMFFALMIKPLIWVFRQVDGSGKWDSLAYPLALLCFAYVGSNLSQSDDPIKDFSLALVFPVILIRMLDGVGASEGALSLVFNFDIKELIIPSILTFLYFGFLHDLGGFVDLDYFQLGLAILHLSMLFLTLVGVKQISRNLTYGTEFKFLFIPLYCTAAAAIFLTCFINFENIKHFNIIGHLLYYTFLFSYIFGVIIGPMIRR